MPRRVFTLIHGTFASGAPWTRDSSPLARALRSGLSADGEEGSDGAVVTRAYRWSGRNSTRARDAAVVGLREHVRGIAEEFPDADHYLVGHSHGGNVAVAAVSDPSTYERVRGVACLSTPFLVARERELGPGAFWIRAAPFAVVVLGVSVGIQAAVESAPLAILAAAGAVLVLGVVLAALMASTNRMLAVLSTGVRPDLNLLIVRSMGDEASNFLGGAHLVGWVLTQVWRGIGELGARLERRSAWLPPRARLALSTAGLATVLLGQAAIASAGLPPAGQATIRVLQFLGLATALVAGAAYLLSALAALVAGTVGLLVAILLAAVMILPYGWEITLAQFLVDVTAEATPPGSWRVHLYAPDRAPGNAEEPSRVSHSRAYADPRVLARLVEWAGDAGGAAVEDGRGSA